MILKQRHGFPRHFMEVVNWNTLAAPGVIGCVDGSFIAAWDIGGIDTETMEETAIEAWLDQLAGGISALGDGEGLRLVRRREPWTAQSGTLQSGTVRSETVYPFKPAGALEAMFLEQDAICATHGYLWQDRITLWYHRHGESVDADPSLEGFEAACRRLEDRLGGCLAMTRLGPVTIRDPADGAPDSAWTDGPAALHPANTGSWSACALTGALPLLLGLPARRVRIDPDALPVALDRLIGFDIGQHSRSHPGRIDDRPVVLLGLEGFREEGVNTGVLARVQSLPQALTWVSAYDAVSPGTMRDAAIKIQRLWRQASADLVANIIGEDQGRRGRYETRMGDQVEDTLDNVASGATGYGRTSTYMAVAGEPGEPHGTLEASVRALDAAIDAAGLTLRRETANFVPAMLSLLPGHEDRNPRAYYIRANAFTGLLPLRTIWQGAPTCPSPLMAPGTPALLRAQARTGEAVNFNLHSGDLGHTLIFGPTGAGKSVVLGLIAAAFMRYDNAQVICFDRQRSIAYACAALRGAFMEPRADGIAGIAPLRHINTLGEPWAIEWLTTLVRLQNVEPDTDMLADLRKAVRDAARSPAPDMAQVSSFVQFDPLRTALDPFIGDGTYGKLFSEDTLFDAEGTQSQGTQTRGGTDSSGADSSGTGTGTAAQHNDLFATAARAQRADAATFSAFETHALMEGDETVRVLVLDYIFAAIQQRFDGRPTLVVFDEAWSFFRHPLFVERIRSWLKEGRKNNVCVVMATQSLADAIRSELTAELLESCPTRLFLPNAGAESAVISEQYASLGITAPEIAQIARMRPKRDYLVCQPEGRRVVAFPLGPVNLSIIGRTSTTDSRRVAGAADPHNLWRKDLEHAWQETADTDHTSANRKDTPHAGNGANGTPAPPACAPEAGVAAGSPPQATVEGARQGPAGPDQNVAEAPTTADPVEAAE